VHVSFACSVVPFAQSEPLPVWRLNWAPAPLTPIPPIVTSCVPLFVTVEVCAAVAPSSTSWLPNDRPTGLRESSVRVPVPASATLDELGAIVREQFALDASSFVAAATTARFGPRPDAQRVLVELRELERRIRAGMTRVERVRGVVSLRSLGFS
jgi:hypothetical protein